MSQEARELLESPKPPLIVDVDNTSKLPKKFRMTTDVVPQDANPLPDLKGLAELRISGSGQFSQGGLRSMMQSIGDEPITIVDLRQECHGFVNGMAVSWYGQHNNANKGLSDSEVKHMEQTYFHELEEAESISFDQLARKSVDIGGPVTSPKLIQNEEQLVRSEGLEYKRFFVSDHHRPLDQVVDAYIEWVLELPANSWLHFHCRGGVGRTSSFMTMFDMMRHAGEVSFEDIMRRHILIGGKDFDLMDPDEPYKYALALERIEFIRTFYEYCLDQRAGKFTKSWSRWLENRSS